MLSGLRHRVTLKPRVEASDSQGSYTVAYPEAAWFDVWASVQPMSGTERAQYRQVESGVTTKIIVRSSAAPSLTRDWIVAFRGVDYDIEAVIEPSYRGQHRTLLAKERR